MTVYDLMEALSYGLEDGSIHESDEVRFAGQPNYPLEYTIKSNVVIEEGKVYLGEARQVGYLKGIIKEEMGW